MSKTFSIKQPLIQIASQHFYKSIYFGINKIPIKEYFFWINFLLALEILFLVSLKGWDSKIFGTLINFVFQTELPKFFSNIPYWFRFIFFSLALIPTILYFMGFKKQKKISELQFDLNKTGLKNAEGEKASITNFLDLNRGRTKIIVKSPGVDIKDYENKSGSLESSFGVSVEKITQSDNKRYFEIFLNKNKIPKRITFESLLNLNSLKHSFMIGESQNEKLFISIEDLPHLLIAGSTGMGKSVFAKQITLSLILTSPYIQYYFIDLKRGLEASFFKSLPNVAIAKNVSEAKNLLSLVYNEMQRRFSILESTNMTKVDYEKHQLDKIVVTIDEASELLSRPKKYDTEYDSKVEAIELAEKISKLARAVGIHLVLSTQKLIKDTIDTRIQENISGRICFEVNTLHGSMNVIGSADAFNLPHIKGRAFWSLGNQLVEVQTPYIDDTEIPKYIELIKEDFKTNKRKNFQELLTNIDFLAKTQKSFKDELK